MEREGEKEIFKGRERKRRGRSVECEMREGDQREKEEKGRSDEREEEEGEESVESKGRRWRGSH